MQKSIYLGRINSPRGFVHDLMWRTRQHPPSRHQLHSHGRQAIFQIRLDFGSQLRGMRRHPRSIKRHTPFRHGYPHLTQMLRILHLPDPSGSGQQGLARDTSPIDTRPAHVVAGKDGRTR
jgi:hypothetical protein